MLLGTRRALLGPWGRYLEKVLLTEPDNLIGCWLQNESVGSVSVDYSGEGNDGAYTGVTLGQAGVPGTGLTSPYFDGTNDYNNIYSAGLVADFSGAEGTLLTWAKVSGAGTWTDGAIRYGIFVSADGSNYVGVRKSSANNTLNWLYNAGGTLDIVSLGAQTRADWMPLAITWSAAADSLLAYIDGTQTGATQSTLGTWAGSLAATLTNIGAGSAVPINSWGGWIGPVILYKKALAATQIAYLSEV